MKARAGRRDTPGEVLKESAFTTPTRSYGDQCIERALARKEIGTPPRARPPSSPTTAQSVVFLVVLAATAASPSFAARFQTFATLKEDTRGIH